MKVTLLNYTPDALDLLVFTKQTRLSQDAALFADIQAWPQERKLAELDYMLGTIQSSWEFVNYTFLIEGVSRAFTHQLVRHRHASYAQQSQRSVDMTNFDYITPPGLPDGLKLAYDEGMEAINYWYQRLLREGAPPQDARGLLPTNVATQIIMGVNLRSLSEQMRLRLCTRTQGETQDVFRAMRFNVLQVHPWAEKFLRVHCAATGTCMFPNYKECPIKPQVFNPATGHAYDGSPDCATSDDIQALWEAVRFEAIPVVAK